MLLNLIIIKDHNCQVHDLITVMIIIVIITSD